MGQNRYTTGTGAYDCHSLTNNINCGKESSTGDFGAQPSMSESIKGLHSPKSGYPTARPSEEKCAEAFIFDCKTGADTFCSRNLLSSSTDKENSEMLREKFFPQALDLAKNELYESKYTSPGLPHQISKNGMGTSHVELSQENEPEPSAGANPILSNARLVL